MKKLGVIIIVLLAVTGLMGVAYGYWTDTLYINGTVTTGRVDAEFFKAVSNDDIGMNDPTTTPGTWSYSTGGGTIQGWTGSRKGVDNASTTVIVTDGISEPVHGNTLHITMTGAYVGYQSSVGALLKNTGTIPIAIESVVCTVTPPAGGLATDVTVSFSGALNEDNHTLIGPGGVKEFGAIYFKWNSVPAVSSVYMLDVTITASQWNLVGP